MQIDHDIREIEERLAARRHRIARTARLARHVAVRKVVSPTGLLTAVGVGFLATVGLFRRKKVEAQRLRRRRNDVKAGKLAGLASLAASAAFALVRSQLGSPLEMAQFVAAKIRRMQERKKMQAGKDTQQRVASQRQGRMAPAG